VEGHCGGATRKSQGIARCQEEAAMTASMWADLEDERDTAVAEAACLRQQLAAAQAAEREAREREQAAVSRVVALGHADRLRQEAEAEVERVTRERDMLEARVVIAEAGQAARLVTDPEEQAIRERHLRCVWMPGNPADEARLAVHGDISNVFRLLDAARTEWALTRRERDAARADLAAERMSKADALATLEAARADLARLVGDVREVVCRWYLASEGEALDALRSALPASPEPVWCEWRNAAGAVCQNPAGHDGPHVTQKPPPAPATPAQAREPCPDCKAHPTVGGTCGKHSPMIVFGPGLPLPEGVTLVVLPEPAPSGEPVGAVAACKAPALEPRPRCGPHDSPECWVPGDGSAAQWERGDVSEPVGPRERCEPCEGTGDVFATCPACGGSGFVTDTSGRHWTPREERCGACAGGMRKGAGE
jgi:hypothetical protein